MAIIGYYITCDDALCDDCFEPLQWAGFESWTEPISIRDDEPVDTPIHCSNCEWIIPAPLTTHGEIYVLDAIVQAQEEPGRSHPIVAAWLRQYGEEIATSLETGS